MPYKQLTEKDRTIIWAMRRAGSNQSDIARKLGCHRSTICRELARNKSINGYDVRSAQLLTVQRKQRQISSPYSEYDDLVNMLTNMGWSKAKQKEFLLRHHPELAKFIDSIVRD